MAINHLFTTEGFVPRCQCMNQHWLLIWCFVAANAIIALSYYAIPFALLWCRIDYRKRFPLVVGRHFILFAFFIFFCGTGHLLDVMMVWHPFYVFKSLWDCCTAFLSAATALAVIHTFLHIKK